MTIITYIIESTFTAPRAADVTTGAAAGLAALPDGSDVLGLVPVHQHLAAPHPATHPVLL